MLFDKILVPLDGSELALRMLVHARRLLHVSGASVALLQVIPDVEKLVETQKALDALRDRLIAAGVAATARAVVGEPAARIAQIAEETRASLIALSTHGRSFVPRLVRGSVAEAVMRASPVPVLVANPRALGESEELPIRRILVPLDGSARGASALGPATEIARLHGAELVLCNAVDLTWSHYPETARPHELALAKDYLARELERSGVRARSIVVEGPPAACILEAVEKEHADLVAIATHGRTGLARMYFGSVADSVVRACRCPILVVRSAGMPAGTTREAPKAVHA